MLRLLKFLKGLSMEDPTDIWTLEEIEDSANLRREILLTVGIEEL